MVVYRDKDLHLYVIVDAVEAIELYQFPFVPSLAIRHNMKSNKAIIFLKVFASIRLGSAAGTVNGPAPVKIVGF